MKKKIEKISRRKFAKDISSTVLYTSSILGVSMFERSLYAEQAKKKLRPTSFGKAKSVIQVWMWGGPCHIDTFEFGSHSIETDMVIMPLIKIPHPPQ